MIWERKRSGISPETAIVAPALWMTAAGVCGKMILPPKWSISPDANIDSHTALSKDRISCQYKANNPNYYKKAINIME